MNAFYHLKKAEPKESGQPTCRYRKKSSFERFKKDKKNVLESYPNSYNNFESAFLSALNEHDRKINKWAPRNHKSTTHFMKR